MKNIRLGVVSGLLLVLSAPVASAHVSLKNGNFFIPFKDLIYPGGYEPKIERVYNSKTSYVGYFGWGWGTEFEAFLTVSVDGSVTVHEYGGGATNRFTPVKFNAAELQKTVTMLAETARSLGQPVNDQYKNKLRTDADYRNQEWLRFLKTGKVKARQLANGEQLVSTNYSYQYITKTAGGYVRKYDNGKVEKYDDAGHLVQISDSNNNFVQLSYNTEGRLVKMVDNFNRKMFFTFNKKGRIERIEGESKKESVYKYNDQEELVYSKDADGNTTNYKYSGDKRHNMTEVAFTEKSTSKKITTEVAYYGKDKFENVKSVKEGDTETDYDYVYDKPEKGYSSVSSTIKNLEGNTISASKYEYWTKQSSKPFGEPWTYKMASTIDGDKTETIYNECCGLPLEITRDGQKTAFNYDVKGRVTFKSTPSETTKLAYNDKVGRVSRVDRFSKGSKKLHYWSEFTYDSKGNLQLAKNSDRKTVKLVYDLNGRISAMVDQDARKLSFKYNEQSKPIEIKDEKLGAITVAYTNSGEVKSVNTAAGRKIAMQVTSAFQNLLEIIRPAGVNLSF